MRRAVEVIRITPRGYCHGVVHAVHIVKIVAADPTTPKPVHVLGQIVHNRHVVDDLTRLGVITLDGPDRLALLDRIREGTVVFTAHGVSPAVKAAARARGLHCVDATCPDVTRTHDLIRDLAARDRQIIYVGRKGHPEPEGAMGEAPGRVHLVETAADVHALHLDGAAVAVVTQTTLSKWDTEALIACIRRRYPAAEVYNEICPATQLRQEAAVQQAADADLVLVVGDRRSNNSNRLVQVVREIAGRPAHLIDSVGEIDPAWLAGARRVAVTSGSSTPSEVTREVVQFLEAYEPGDPP